MVDQRTPPMYRMRSRFTLSIIGRTLSWLAIVVLLLFLFPLVVPYFDKSSSHPYAQTALIAERTLDGLVEQAIPTTIAGRDMSRWIVVVGMLLFSRVLSWSAERSAEKAQWLNFQSNVERWKATLGLPDSADVLTPVNEKLEQLKGAKRKDRERLLEEFAHAKRKLDAMGRDLAFLAIGVVDSSAMNDGEERASIEHDFKEYRRFVDRELKSHGCWKLTWTQDGVMSVFTTADAVVEAAREVVKRLKVFNREVRAMRRDFVIRCGVNNGFIYFDDAMPLEEVSDRVIDTAVHMQQQARPNTVSLAKPAIEPLNDRGGFEPAGKVVDGYEVYEWELKRS
jgi:class 3 adenylate cyclase